MSESVEVRLLRLYLAETGVPHRVTSTGRAGPVQASYHNRPGTNGHGLALDAAGLEPGWNTPELAAVYQALEPLGPHCAELIYSGPGGGFWKHGQRVGPYATDTHHNHVHIALYKGTVVHHPKEEPMSDLVQVNAPVVNLVPTPTGKGYWLVCSDGGVFSFGDAQYYGRVEYRGA